MTRKRMGAAVLCLVLLLAGVLFTACGGGTEGFAANGAPELSNPEYVRTPPPLVLAEYVGANEVAKDKDGNSAVIDMTNVNKGYIAVKSTSAAATLVKIPKPTAAPATRTTITSTVPAKRCFCPLPGAAAATSFSYCTAVSQRGTGRCFTIPSWTGRPPWCWRASWPPSWCRISM